MWLRKLFLIFIVGVGSNRGVKADLWGADLPLLFEIVSNTLYSLQELRSQSELLRRELRGIDDKIERLKTIQELVAPKDSSAWKDPAEALRRLQKIYQTLPPEFRTQKSDEIERQISQAMSTAGLLTESARPVFDSGKQMEKKGLDVGPAVANKMTASGVGTLIALQSQNQVAQATIISLLSQMMAESGSRETARLKSQSREYKSLGAKTKGFSSQIKLVEVER